MFGFSKSRSGRAVSALPSPPGAEARTSRRSAWAVSWKVTFGVSAVDDMMLLFHYGIGNASTLSAVPVGLTSPGGASGRVKVKVLP